MIQCRMCDEDLILSPCDCCMTIRRTWCRFCETRFILAKFSYLRSIGEWWAAWSGSRYMKVHPCPPLYKRTHRCQVSLQPVYSGKFGNLERIWTVLRLFLCRSGCYSLLDTGLWTLGCGLPKHRARGRTGTAAWAGRSYLARFWIELCLSAQLLDTRSWLAAAADSS